MRRFKFCPQITATSDSSNRPQLEAFFRTVVLVHVDEVREFLEILLGNPLDPAIEGLEAFSPETQTAILWGRDRRHGWLCLAAAKFQER
jgi:hypothetical protein